VLWLVRLEEELYEARDMVEVGAQQREEELEQVKKEAQVSASDMSRQLGKVHICNMTGLGVIT
jgi:hypothetical protein